LEEEYGLDEMDEKEITRIITVGDLVRYLQNKLDM
jgi:acyl carrier protein